VAWHVTNLDFQPQRRETVTRLQPTVHVDGFKLKAFAHEPLHDFWRLDHCSIRRMSQHLGFRLPHNLSPALGMVPMTVRNP
jgi:hypothetical protein